jgi:hypothetical protein
MAAICCQLLVAACSAAKVPHATPNPGRNSDGLTRVNIMLAGTSATRYETKKIKTMIEYWSDVRPKSLDRPPVLALLSNVVSSHVRKHARSNLEFAYHEPDVGPIKVAQQIQNPCAGQDTPV